MALIPGLAGISGADYVDPAAFNAGFRIAITIAAGLLVTGAAMAFAGLKSRPGPKVARDRMLLEENRHCPTAGPPLHPTRGDV